MLLLEKDEDWGCNYWIFDGNKCAGYIEPIGEDSYTLHFRGFWDIDEQIRILTELKDVLNSRKKTP